MALIPKFRRPKGVIRARAIVVDLANVRVPVKEDSKVVVMDRPQDPFLFGYIDDIKRDIDSLGLRVPVFYLLDTLVKPHEMSVDEEEDFISRLTNPIFDDGHIWRIGSAHQKADFAICQLVNELGALVISGDRFSDHKREGRIERPDDLLQFAPRRASRNVSHKFVNIGHGHKKAGLADLLDLPASEAEYWERWKAHVDVILQWIDPVAAQFAEAELRLFTFPEVDAPMPIVESTAPIQPSRREMSSIAIPPRPPEIQTVLSGDYWGLDKLTDQWVKVVGRLFNDTDGWALRDLACAKGVSLPGVIRSRSSNLVDGGWFASVGVLRKDSEGFFLESPELAATGRLADIKSACSVHFEGHRQPYTPWGPAPWHQTQITEETPVVPSENVDVLQSEDVAAGTAMPNEAAAHQGVFSSAHSDDSHEETSAITPGQTGTGVEKMAAPPMSVPVGRSSTEPGSPPTEEATPVAHPSPGAAAGAPHVAAGTTEGGRRTSLVFLAVAVVLAVAAVILVVL